MAKHRRSSRPQQFQHGKKSTPSQHDKRSRLSSLNPTQRKTVEASIPLVGGISVMVADLSAKVCYVARAG